MASIIQNGSGNWRVQIESRGQREYKTFKLKSRAQQWAKQRESELQRGLLASVDDAQKTPLGAVIDRCRERALPNKRNYSDKITLNRLDNRFGNHRLIGLQSSDICYRISPDWPLRPRADSANCSESNGPARDPRVFPKLMGEVADYLTYREDDEIARTFAKLIVVPHEQLDRGRRSQLIEHVLLGNPKAQLAL